MGLDRREFACSFLAGGLLGSATGSLAAAQTPPPAAAEKPQPPPSLLILSWIVQQCPDQSLSEDDLANILADIRLDLSRGAELSKFPLTNADEPATVFAARPRPAADGGPS
jgi:hypothetical protein